ncbi:MAG TPA: hypothetical protein VNW53_08705 [Phenylobacterium sp.]|jgi:hypothetical protein|uniref:hypothetical protein n=1 Tax=Phenylobacterium sp. TaxID=1871053 RepID=UPI002C8E9529|nr:hypothetical protein [Phenylobacterium sp.]HXA39065.1 hypothetical protein [Phenylobacterium sp.]
MPKLFAGAAVAAAMLGAWLPARASAPEAPQPPPAFDQQAETVTARAHLVFANAVDPPVVGDLTVIQQGPDLAVVKTSFRLAQPPPTAPTAAPCPDGRDHAAPAGRTRG